MARDPDIQEIEAGPALDIHRRQDAGHGDVIELRCRPLLASGRASLRMSLIQQPKAMRYL